LLELENKKILYLDDTKSELELFGDEFSKLTKNLILFHYQDESLEELTEKIILENPDIVLLDYNLSTTLKGSDVCKKLREENFSGTIIGFSTVPCKERFLESGADSFILKDVRNPKSIIEELRK